MGRPDLRTVRPDFANLSRASTSAFIAREEAKLAKQKPLTKRRVRAGRGSQGVFFRTEGRRSFQQRQGIRNAQNNTVRRNISQARSRLKTLDRKEKTSVFEIEKGRTETFLSPEQRTRIGARAAAIAAARRKGGRRGARLVTSLSRTAARRGRKVTTTVVVKKTRTIKGRSCTARPNQDVGLLTRDEAACEINSKRLDKRKPTQIGGRRIRKRQGGVKLNEREARLLIRAAQGTRTSRRVGRGRRARTVTSFRGGRSDDLLGFSSGLLSQAKAGLGVLDFLKAPSNFDTEVKRVGGRSSGSIVTIRRLKPNIRKNQNLIKSRGNFLLSGGTNAEFDTILHADITNRQSGRAAAARVSSGSRRGTTILNKASVDPFFRGSRRGLLL